MNVDEAMEAAAEFRADMETRPAWTLFSENVAVALSFEVNRLRAELAAAKSEVERLRAELAAAKAVSGWPAGYTEIRTNPGGNVVIYTENHENAYRLIAWLRDRMKDKTPPAT